MGEVGKPNKASAPSKKRTDDQMKEESDGDEGLKHDRDKPKKKQGSKDADTDEDGVDSEPSTPSQGRRGDDVEEPVESPDDLKHKRDKEKKQTKKGGEDAH